MRKNDPIKNLMSEDIHSVQKGQPLSEVFKILQSNNIHHVAVLDGKRLVGVISYTDLMQISLGVQSYDLDQLWPTIDAQHELIDVMTASPTTLNHAGVVRDAAEALSTGAYHSLPVTDDAGELVGMITSTDLIRYLIDQY
ncbi:MAG: CBS domain-containing protein [Arenicella sp.]|jgi:acetoin utilization protein AcuB